MSTPRTIPVTKRKRDPLAVKYTQRFKCSCEAFKSYGPENQRIEISVWRRPDGGNPFNVNQADLEKYKSQPIDYNPEQQQSRGVYPYCKHVEMVLHILRQQSGNAHERIRVR